MEHIPLRVGHNLKMHRKSRGLSLDKLAELTGVSKAMLAQVERGDSNPTITLLWKIANGLRISVTALITGETPDVTVVRLRDVEPLASAEGAYRAFPLFPFDAVTHFEQYAVEMSPGCVHQSEPHHEGVEEFVVVTEGVLELRLDERQYTIGQGDAIRFPADQGHTYSNPTDAVTRLQVTIRYPF